MHHFPNHLNVNIVGRNETAECDQTENEDTAKDCRGFPKYALVRGLYQGSIPKELADLNWFERSMISIYSCISRVKVLSGKHYKKCGTAYTTINDLVKVTEFLPRAVTVDEFAVLRHRSETTSRNYK